MLLSLSTVGSEGIRENASGRGGMRTRSVVNGFWWWRLATGHSTNRGV